MDLDGDKNDKAAELENANALKVGEFVGNLTFYMIK